MIILAKFAIVVGILIFLALLKFFHDYMEEHRETDRGGYIVPSFWEKDEK